MNILPFRTIRAKYERLKPEGHWFDEGTMRFFKTKLPENGYELASGWYFITRETNPSGISRYSVRRLDDAGDIRTVGEFHSYTSAAAARAAIKQIEVLGAAA